MKRVLFTLLVLPMCALSQKSDRIYNRMNYTRYKVTSGQIEDQTHYFRHDLTIEQRAKKGIASVTIVEVDNKKGVNETIVLNRQGRIEKRTTPNMTEVNTFQGDSLLLSTETRRKKKVKRVNYTYEGNQVVSIVGLDNGKEEYRYSYLYEGQKLLENTYQEKKHTYKIKNEYEDEKISKTTYEVDGEVAKVWFFDCNPKGEVTGKKEELSSVCYYKEELSDGSYVKYKRELKDGKPYLSESKYSVDSTYLGTKMWASDTILVYEHIIDDRKESTAHFSEKGIYEWGYTSLSNEEGQTIERTYFSGKKKREGRREKFVFENDLMHEISYSFKGKQERTYALSFTFF